MKQVMDSMPLRGVSLSVEVEQWPRATPVRITGYTFDVINVVRVVLRKDGCVGYGEGGAIFYKNDTADSMRAQLETLRNRIESGLSRRSVQEWLPVGGARNALDCALWDLQAQLSGRAVWQLLGMEQPRPLLTAFTCHADEPEKVAARARGYANARAIKLKLTGEPVDADRVRAVRESLPEVWLGIDANQGFTRESLERLMPVLVAAKVSLIEQPFAVGQESLLDGFQAPIPVAADESLQGFADIPSLAGRFDVLNIKLDKCGGLTEGVAMARAASALGFELMVGNMSGTSLAMAPAFLVGQLCNVVDLDGPAMLRADRPVTVQYDDGYVRCPENLWGAPRARAA